MALNCQIHDILNMSTSLLLTFKFIFHHIYLLFFDNNFRYVLMNAGEPLNEIEAEEMMKEADKDGDGTIDYEGIFKYNI